MILLAVRSVQKFEQTLVLDHMAIGINNFVIHLSSEFRVLRNE